MAFLDVSDVLHDPDFCDEIGLNTVIETVGDDGNVSFVTTPYIFWGVVTNESGDVIERTSDASQVHGTIIIHSIHILKMAGPGTDADLITWPAEDGNQYLVKDVKNYSHFGEGFCAATCSLQPVAGA